MTSLLIPLRLQAHHRCLGFLQLCASILRRRPPREDLPSNPAPRQHPRRSPSFCITDNMAESFTRRSDYALPLNTPFASAHSLFGDALKYHESGNRDKATLCSVRAAQMVLSQGITSGQWPVVIVDLVVSLLNELTSCLAPTDPQQQILRHHAAALQWITTRLRLVQIDQLSQQTTQTYLSMILSDSIQTGNQFDPTDGIAQSLMERRAVLQVEVDKWKACIPTHWRIVLDFNPLCCTLLDD